MINLPLKILIIEDNIADAELLSYHLKKLIKNPTIQVTTLFDETISIINVFEPDIILSDYQLNSFNGLDVLNYVNEKFLPIPIVFITGTVNNKELAPYTIIEEGNGIILKEDMPVMQNKLYPFLKNSSKLNLIKKYKIEILKVECIYDIDPDIDIQEVIDEVKLSIQQAS